MFRKSQDLYKKRKIFFSVHSYSEMTDCLNTTESIIFNLFIKQTVQGLQKINILQLTAKNIHYVITMNDEPGNVSVKEQTNRTKVKYYNK